VTQEAGISRAAAGAEALRNPEYTIVEKMVLGARILAHDGHGGTLAGQVTCRTEHNGQLAMRTTVYGRTFDEAVSDDFVTINETLHVVVGAGAPNMATRFHLHVYRARPDIQCIVHTHARATSALAMTGVPLHVAHMDVMAFYEDVNYLPKWPGVPFGDEEGEIIVKVLGDRNAALLAHHGLIVGGRTIEEATYRAYFFERAAALQLAAMAAVGGDVSKLPRVDPALGITARNWRISPGPVNAHFHAWAREALRRDGYFLH
jgi:L-fuculose-phosphate aldolase